MQTKKSTLLAVLVMMAPERSDRPLFQLR